ncbi:MAG: UxaA family hydrolase, partial [Dehalococcoidia bacterium]|nr:UxaA family hydrolase [Dehalococcoidia bacterium]
AVLDKGIRIAQKMVSDAALLKRQAFDLSHITLSIKCGASDTTSALASNPVVGWVADSIVNSGGRAIFTETAELIGAEHIMARRGANEKIANRIYEVVARLEKRIRDAGVDIRGSEPTPGNIQGGLTTLEEKSLGAIIKAGTTSLQGVLEWAEKPEGKGLFFMDGSPWTPQLYSGMAAAGAQMMVASLGGGLPVRFHSQPAYCGIGVPILPVIKVLSNPKDMGEKEYFDLMAGTVIQGKESIPEAGDRLLKEIIDVASGKPTKTEMLPRYYYELMEFYTTELRL